MKAPRQTKAKNSSSALASFTPVQSGLLQRKCACGGTPGPSGEGDACRKKKLQRRSENLDPSSIIHHPSSVPEVPPIVHEVLRSPGQPLDLTTRISMESRFGHDFRRVRVHVDSKAAESAAAVNARAYTVGFDIAFGAGQYTPASAKGTKLLAHELVHVLQQDNHAHSGGLTVSQPTDAHEQEADRIADGGSSRSAIVGLGQKEIPPSGQSPRVHHFLPKSVARGLSRQGPAIVRQQRQNCALPQGGVEPFCFACVNSETKAVVRWIVRRAPCSAIPQLRVSACWEVLDATSGVTQGVVYQDPQTKKGIAVTDMKSGSMAPYPDVGTALDFSCSSLP